MICSRWVRNYHTVLLNRFIVFNQHFSAWHVFIWLINYTVYTAYISCIKVYIHIYICIPDFSSSFRGFFVYLRNMHPFNKIFSRSNPIQFFCQQLWLNRISHILKIKLLGVSASTAVPIPRFFLIYNLYISSIWPVVLITLFSRNLQLNQPSRFSYNYI